MICKPDQDELYVDTFLLSCRVLGRGVEHRVAAFLGQTAASRGLSRVMFPYEQTKKNCPCARFPRESLDWRANSPARMGSFCVCPRPHWQSCGGTAP